MIGTGLVTKSFGGLVFTNDGTKTTILGIAGDYNRIGDASTTAASLDSEDDLMITGDGEVKGKFWFGGGSTYYLDNDGDIIGRNISGDRDITCKVDTSYGVYLGASNDAGFNYSAADADAKILAAWVDESLDSGNNVPVFAFGEQTVMYNNDLNLFNAIVEPIIAAIDLDGDSYAYIGHSGDDVPRVGTAGTGAAGIILTNPKNAAASALSGTQLDVEIDIGGVPYHFTVYPTKA